MFVWTSSQESMDSHHPKHHRNSVRESRCVPPYVAKPCVVRPVFTGVAEEIGIIGSRSKNLLEAQGQELQTNSLDGQRV